MQYTVVYVLSFLAFALAFMMLVQGLSRRVDMFSFRNLYLFGFIVYQLISPAIALYTEKFYLFRVSSPAKTSKIYLLFTVVYIAVFLLSYHRLKLASWFAKKFSGPPRDIGDSFFIGLAIAIVLIALPTRFIGPHIPFIRTVSVQVAIALASVAAAIAGWVWSNRRFNLAFTALMLVIVGSSFAISMVGSFGRRAMLGVLMGFAWGVYHRRVRQLPPARMLMYIFPIMVGVLVVISAFTAIRDNRTAQSDVRDTMQSMVSAKIDKGLKDILAGQATGTAALWAVEQWPAQFEMRPLFSLQYMAYWYVPRILWPEKPVPLGNTTARLGRVRGVNQDAILLPPGVIGYAAAEGGFWAVIVYALFFGQFLRFFDELIRLNPFNPFILLPAGCTIAQLLGLARGGISVFTNLIVLSFISAFVILFFANKMFGRSVQQSYYAPWPQSR